jgi:hypothetical protein
MKPPITEEATPIMKALKVDRLLELIPFNRNRRLRLTVPRLSGRSATGACSATDARGST